MSALPRRITVQFFGWMWNQPCQICFFTPPATKIYMSALPRQGTNGTMEGDATRRTRPEAWDSTRAMNGRSRSIVLVWLSWFRCWLLVCVLDRSAVSCGKEECGTANTKRGKDLTERENQELIHFSTPGTNRTSVHIRFLLC